MNTYITSLQQHWQLPQGQTSLCVLFRHMLLSHFLWCSGFASQSSSCELCHPWGHGKEILFTQLSQTTFMLQTWLLKVLEALRDCETCCDAASTINRRKEVGLGHTNWISKSSWDCVFMGSSAKCKKAWQKLNRKRRVWWLTTSSCNETLYCLSKSLNVCSFAWCLVAAEWDNVSTHHHRFCAKDRCWAFS